MSFIPLLQGNMCDWINITPVLPKCNVILITLSWDTRLLRCMSNEWNILNQQKIHLSKSFLLVWKTQSVIFFYHTEDRYVCFYDDVKTLCCWFWTILNIDLFYVCLQRPRVLENMYIQLIWFNSKHTNLPIRSVLNRVNCGELGSELFIYVQQYFHVTLIFKKVTR